MKYAVTTTNTAPTDDNLYTTDIPSATDAGTYYVWYKVVGDDNHVGTEPAYVTTVIRDASSYPAEKEKTKLTVTAKDQTIGFGGALKNKASAYEITGLATGDTATVTLEADPKTYTIVPSVTIKRGDQDVTADYEIATATGNLTTKDVPMVKAVSKGKSITVTWDKTEGADGYRIYAGYCGSQKAKLIKTIKGNKKFKYVFKMINGKALNTKKALKIRVQAYRLVGGKKVIINTSITAHVAGSGDAKRANATDLKLKKTAYTLEKGKTAKISAKVKLANKKKTQLSDGHARPLRFATSDKSIATVSDDGKITAVGSGTCDVYVYAVDGATKKIKVTVK